MADNAELIDVARRYANSGLNAVWVRTDLLAEIVAVLEAADARIAVLEAQIARDAAFNEASRHYGEADLEKAVDHMQEAIKIVGQHGARRKR